MPRPGAPAPPDRRTRHAPAHPQPQITIATSLTLRVGSMAEQTFNAVERVDEYCHLPQEAAYDNTVGGGGGKAAGGRGPPGGGSSGSASSAQRPRGRAGAGGGLREPLLPLTAQQAGSAAAGDGVAPAAAAAAAAPAAAAAAGSSRGRAGGALMAVNGVAPEGWPSDGSIEFSDVKMR
jgi:hypothetical protein